MEHAAEKTPETIEDARAAAEMALNQELEKHLGDLGRGWRPDEVQSAWRVSEALHIAAERGVFDDRPELKKSCDDYFEGGDSWPWISQMWPDLDHCTKLRKARDLVAPRDAGQEFDTTGWPTVSAAARLLCKEMDNTIQFGAAKTRINRGCSDRAIVFSGTGRARRINPNSLSAYILSCRNRALEPEDTRRDVTVLLQATSRKRQ